MTLSPPLIAAARLLLASRKSLVDTAVVLGTTSHELDAELWRYIDVPTADLMRPARRKKYRPDF